MKKLLLSLVAIVALFATSCVTDATDTLVRGDQCTVTFTVAPDAFGTRAINDGTKATQLSYAVYNSDWSSFLFEGKATLEGLSATIPVQLVKNNTYNFVFWAQSPEASYYTVDFKAAGGPLVTVDYTGAQANDDKRDAFFGRLENYLVTGPISATVTLTRPFAQVNFATNDTELAEKAGFNVANATTTVTIEAFSTLNLANGTVDGLKTVTFAATANPTETLTVKGSDVEWDWLAMNYILWGADEASLSKCEMTIATNNMTSITVEVPAAPARRNWRTNLVGSLLIEQGNIEIIVDQKFEGEIPNPEDDNLVHELILAAAVGGEVTLTNDVVLTQPLKVTADMTINLNGHTISNAVGYAIENYAQLTISGDGAFEGLGGIRSHGGKLTIEGGNYTCASDWSAGTYNHILKAVNTEVVINGGTFDATIGGTNNAMINVSENSVVTINGGTFKNVNGVIPQFAPYMFTYEKNGKLIINDGEFYGGWRFNGETTTTDIYGGNFTVSYDGQSFHATATHVLTVYGGVFSLENGGKLNPTNHCAAGYKAIENNGLYYVVAEEIDAVATTPAEVLSAMKVAGQTVCVVPTADGSAHKLEGKMSLAEGVSLIGMGDKPVALFNDWGSNAFAKQAHFTNTTVENINFTNNLVIDAGIANGNVHFKNCVFGGHLAHQGVHFDSGNATIVFDNCTFVGRNMLGASLTKVIFNDCTFLNKKSSLTGADKWTGVNMWGKYEFNNCVFDTEATCNVKTDGVEATFTNCKYTDNRNIEEVVNNYNGYTATIIIDGELLPTPVSTTEQFANALSVGGNIALKENIAVEKIDLTNLTNDVVIDANGKTITTNSNYGIQVKAGKNITLKNAKVEITVDGNYITYAAGLKIENGDYLGNTITLKNCEIKMCNDDWAYAVNMPASVKNLNLVIDGCTLEGAIALQCWGDNNTITATNSHFICNYKTNAMYTSYCVVLQGDGTNKAENNTLNISGCEFSYSGVDNFNSVIKAVSDVSGAGNNTITVVDCTYNNKVTAY